MRQKLRMGTVLALGGLALAGTASAEDLKARSWAASCAACHGTNGRSAAEEIKPLAGKPKADIVKALKDAKAGEPKTLTVMHQHAKGYTDDEIERIAEFFSKQPK
ncbi:MAG TPA: c-type cytochrome [Burkholderiales bacterium]|nr:c-type cytochrome [Burkholderiales bacterium]